MKEERVKISVVTVCYNAVREVEETILSVINQTYDNLEYIVIDGNSKDGTIDIIRKYEDKITRWISEPDCGVFDAMNKGLRLATGDWINFMNAGDRFVDEIVLDKIFGTKNYSQYAVLHGDIYRDKPEPDFLWTDIPFYNQKRKFSGMNICHQAIFTSRKWACSYPFDLQYHNCADYNMMKDINKAGGTFLKLNMPIAIYNTDGMSNAKWKQTFDEEIKICNINRDSLFYKYLFYKRVLSHKLRLT